MSKRSLLLITAFLALCVFVVLVDCQSHEEDDDDDDEEAKTRRRNVRHQHHKHVHHAKYALPLILAAVVMKLVIVPMVFKSMAAMSIISVILSFMSLFVSSIVGFAKAAATAPKDMYSYPSVKFLHYGLRKRDDLLSDPVKSALAQQMLQQQQLLWQPPTQQQVDNLNFFPKN